MQREGKVAAPRAGATEIMRSAIRQEQQSYFIAMQLRDCPSPPHGPGLSAAGLCPLRCRPAEHAEKDQQSSSPRKPSREHMPRAAPGYVEQQRLVASSAWWRAPEECKCMQQAQRELTH